MRDPRRAARSLLLVAALAGCGDDLGDDTGSGTRTLRVIARGVIDADFTSFEIELGVRGGGIGGTRPVVDAEVTLTDRRRGRTARATEPPGGQGLYIGRLEGAVDRVGLSVEAGDDELDGAIAGPEVFEITRPPDGATVSRGSADRLLVAWTRPEDESIDRVTLSVLGADGVPRSTGVVEGDPGEGRVDLPAPAIGPQPLGLVVRRRDVVRLSGGLEGSELTLDRASRVAFELVP